MSKFLINLNKEQEFAVKHFSGPLAIIASAGSGKTKVITHKIAYLIEDQFYNPESILAITFTNKAAKEMKDRLYNMIGPKANKAWILTYHSMCARILRKEISHFGYPSNFAILDEIDQKQILSRVYKNLNITSKTISYSLAIHFISKAKNSELTYNFFLDDAESDTDKYLALIYKAYSEELFNIKALDFDDLLFFVKNLFKEKPSIAKNWASKFEYVLIDEFQDTSFVQYEIVKALVKDDKLTIVGDPDQTIYTWRKADVSLINNFQNHFENSTVIKLEWNYRSTKSILDKANALIKNNTRRIDKNLKTTKDDGEEIEFYHGETDEDEARWIAQKIKYLKNQKELLKNIAILYRANYISANIEKALIQENINYKVWGGIRFYQREEIKDVISYLKIINNGDEISLKRMINIPARRIGESAQDNIFNAQIQKGNIPLWELLKDSLEQIELTQNQKTSLSSFINSIKQAQTNIQSKSFSKVLEDFLNEINYFSCWNSIDHFNKLENIRELLKFMQEFEKNNPNKNVNDFLDEVSLYLDKDEETSSDFVWLMTVHTSKGLEFDTVFIAGFSDSVFPSPKALEDDENGGGLEEERRLAYVAITRAKQKLFISDSQGYSQDFKFQKKPSRFLKEMGINIRDFTSKYIAPKSVNENYTNENRNFIVGDKINHDIFGLGIIVSINNDLIDVAFKGPHGVKTIMKNHKAIQKVGT